MRAPLQRPTTYDIEQEQQRHDDALHWFGELNCFLMFWDTQDFEDGLVGRCPTCYTDSEYAESYGQPDDSKCPDCFGTTFEGGLRAKLYRPAVWDTSDTERSVQKRGFIVGAQGTIQAPSNLVLRPGDVVVRADDSRWMLSVPEVQEISTGFGSQRNNPERMLRSRVRVTLEAPTAVSHLVTVDLAALATEGWKHYVPHSPHPSDEVPTP